jgi:hypothetical protein
MEAMSIIWMLVVHGRNENGTKTGFQQPISPEVVVYDADGFISDLDPGFKPYLIEKWAQLVPIPESIGLAKFECHDNGFMELLEEEQLDKNILANH